MNDIVSESPAAESKRWIGRFLIAVVLGEAIWAFLVAITNHLAIPAMARLIGVADEQSPLYLGHGDYNVPALFAAVLQLCLAGIVAVLLNSWSQRGGRVRTRVVSRTAVSRIDSVAPSILAPPVTTSAAAPSITSSAATPIAGTPPAPANTPSVPAQPVAASVQTPVPQPTQAAPPSSSPAKPKKAKPVYYNIVGEPIEDDE